MQQVITHIKDGWPIDKHEVSPEVSQYWHHRAELTECNGIVFKGDKVVIPNSLRQDMLKRIHEGHQGINRCKSRARQCLFWTGLSGQIEAMVARCSACQTFRVKNQHEPMIPHEIPDRPWVKTATDLFQFQGKNYLLVVDYYFKYTELALAITVYH
ncbi:hypothetical protein HOLleu_01984 [Holothuria leucospilota]|uniref:Integrase zinc-binding domain-containing protein n=1 Tax=Holothuria leucospilota TaxID=206669 RepID=A0A9Q1CQM8_HOLLE|nr:hypothetical protein HOLleu_01984 [Holothuria leucospilota]